MLSAGMRRVLIFILDAAMVLGCTTALCSAETAAVIAREKTITEELKSQEDPTILKSSIWSDTEWNRYKDGTNDIDETLGVLWAWRVSNRQEWALRLKVPFRTHIAGDAAGDSDRQGLGDIKLATGTAFRLSKSWRTAVGVEMRFPSATNELGNNVWQAQLFGAIAGAVTPRLTLSPSFEYNKSVAEAHSAPPQHFLEMFFPAIFVLPRHWSVSARYEAKVDFENAAHWTHSGKFVISKQLEQLPLGFSLSIKKPFDGGNKEFQTNFVITYYFRPQKR